MNAKYYPALRKYSEYAHKVLTHSPDIAKKAKKPSDMVVSVYNSLCDLSIVSDFAHMEHANKQIALEVSKVIFYGYHVEVNAHYNYK